MSVTKGTVKAMAGAFLWAGLFCLLGLNEATAGSSGSFVVAPVEKPSEVRLLPARAWPPPESDQGQMLLKLSYLRGILDALQYAEVAPATAGKLLIGLKGMNLHQIAAEIDRFYLADPRRRDLPPAAVLFRILPRSKGKPEPTVLPRKKR